MVQLSNLLSENPWMLGSGNSTKSKTDAASSTHSTGGKSFTTETADGGEDSSSRSSGSTTSSSSSSSSSVRSYIRERDSLSSTGEEYYPPYGGPTEYLKGYSYAVRPMMKTKVSSKSLLYAYGSAPFPRDGYGHDEEAPDYSGGTASPTHVKSTTGGTVSADATGSTASAGSTPGQPVVGRDRVLQRPPGVPASILWLQQAADMGNAEALFVLAWRYEHGLGLVKDRAVTDQLFKW